MAGYVFLGGALGSMLRYMLAELIASFTWLRGNAHSAAWALTGNNEIRNRPVKIVAAIAPFVGFMVHQSPVSGGQRQ